MIQLAANQPLVWSNLEDILAPLLLTLRVCADDYLIILVKDNLLDKFSRWMSEVNFNSCNGFLFREDVCAIPTLTSTYAV